MAERVGIVGGGFSGLLSAWLLERALGDAVEVVLFEAGDRIGGRVRTAHVPEVDATYDAGVAEFYDIAGNPQLRHLIAHLGLESRPLTGTPYFVIDDKVVHDDTDLARLLGQRGMDRVRRFWERGTALRPPEDYAQAGRPQDNGHPWLRRTFEDVLREIDDPRSEWFTAMQCHSDLATEPARTSGLFGMDNLLIDHPGYCSMYTLTDGNEGLIRALADRVQSPVLRDAAVSTVRADDERGLGVLCATPGDQGRTFEFDTLIVTVTPPGLRTIHWEGATLSAALAAHVRHHDHGAVYTRVTLLCRRRFWRRHFPEDYFVTDQLGGATVYDQSPDTGAGGVGILSWLVGGADALALAGQPDHEVVAVILGAMPGDLTMADDLLLASRVDRWTGAAGVSGLPGGVPLLSLDRRHNPDPHWPQLFLVGDYLYDSTLCGALDAVLYAVTRIIERVSPQPDAAATKVQELFLAPAGTRVETPHAPAAAFFLDERVVLGR